MQCGVPRKQRIKRGQSHISAERSRIYILSLPRPSILSSDTFHFFSPPTVPDSSSRALPRTAGETVMPPSSCSSSRPRELVHTAYRAFFRGDRIRRGSLQSPAERYARGRNFYEMENGGGRLADLKEKGNDSKEEMETDLRAQWRRWTGSKGLKILELAIGKSRADLEIMCRYLSEKCMKITPVFKKI